METPPWYMEGAQLQQTMWPETVQREGGNSRFKSWSDSDSDSDKAAALLETTHAHTKRKASVDLKDGRDHKERKTAEGALPTPPKPSEDEARQAMPPLAPKSSKVEASCAMPPLAGAQQDDLAGPEASGPTPEPVEAREGFGRKLTIKKVLPYDPDEPRLLDVELQKSVFDVKVTRFLKIYDKEEYQKGPKISGKFMYPEGQCASVAEEERTALQQLKAYANTHTQSIRALDMLPTEIDCIGITSRYFDNPVRGIMYGPVDGTLMEDVKVTDLSPSRCQMIMKAVLRAIAKLLTAGIWCDYMGPSNIFLSNFEEGSGEPKIIITDFSSVIRWDHITDPDYALFRKNHPDRLFSPNSFLDGESVTPFAQKGWIPGKTLDDLQDWLDDACMDPVYVRLPE